MAFRYFSNLKKKENSLFPSHDIVKKIQKEQAKRDKLLAVFNVLADTPAAIVQGLSQGGAAGAVLAAGIAAVQLATALALDIPQFKKGVIVTGKQIGRAHV